MSDKTETPLTSLTSANDVKEEDIPKFVEGMNDTELTEEETQEAVKDLVDNIVVKKYRTSDRLYSDPSIKEQDICLVSFIPSQDAKPDKHGIFGMMKVRGSYCNEKDAQERCEYLIKKVDSRHKIFMTYVGRPFPVTENRFFAQEREQIDINNEVEKIAAWDTQKISNKEEQELKEIEDRRKQVEKEVKMKPEDIDPLDDYITTKVSRSNCLWMYTRCMEKVKELKENYERYNKHLAEHDEKDPELQNKYKDKYLETLSERDIKPDYENIVQYFEDENCVKSGIES